MNEETTSTMASSLPSLGGVLLVVLIAFTLLLPHLLSFWQGQSKSNDHESNATTTIEPNSKSTMVSVKPSTDTAERDKGFTSSSQSSNLRQRNSQSANDAMNDSQLDLSSNNNWRCACEGGFLPPGLVQTFGGAEAVMRMSAGQCYHKQT